MKTMQADKIFVAMDDSEASRRILPTVAARARESDSVRLHLCHLPPALPPELLESRGSADSKEEERIERKQETAQSEWVEKETAKGERLVAESKKVLEGLDVASERIETEVTEPLRTHEKLADAILDHAQALGCGTVAVGQRSFSALRELIHTHLSDALKRRSGGPDIWVIE